MPSGKTPTTSSKANTRTGAQEQLYIENNGMIASFDPQQGITVWGSLQCPYYVHKALMALFSLPADKVRVVQMETGGRLWRKRRISLDDCGARCVARDEIRATR